MPKFIDNLGLDFLFNNEETTMNFISYLAQNGKAIKGYHDCPTLFKLMGDIDFFVKTRKSEDDSLEVYDIDTHCCGPYVWQMRNTGIEITTKHSSPTGKAFIFKDAEDDTGMVPIHLINADVLPSFLEDDVVNIQMCAFPLEINYYKSEDDYTEHQPIAKDGNHWLLADGSLIPANFLVNHAKNNDNKEKDYSTDDYVLFKGTVKNIYHGAFEIDGEQTNTFIRCIIETNFGDLMLAHTIDQIETEQRDNLHIGAIVSGVCVLSGDVAILEYTNGIVKDFNNNFRLLSDIIVNGQAERMRSILCEDAIYISDTTKKSFVGANEIIERFKQINDARKGTCFATSATITELKSDDLEYPIGTQCILISYNTETDYTAILFFDVTESGNIKRIYTTNDNRYYFREDKILYSSPTDNCDSPPKQLIIWELEEGLDYIKNYDLDLYNEVLLKFQEIEKSETEDFVINIEKSKILGPLVYDIFEKTNVKLELSYNTYRSYNCAHILTKEKDVSVSGKYKNINHHCFLFSPQVETIIFQDGIEGIDDCACQNLKNLKAVYLPETLKTLGSHCFANCPNLENVFFKNTVCHIDPSAFEGTKWFDQFKEDFVIVNNQLLKYNGTLKEIIIPEGVKSINFQVFYKNKVIEKVIFPKSLEKLCVAAFADCSNLKEVSFQGKKLKTIYPLAFDGCRKLKEVVLPKSIKEIGCEAFSIATTIICHNNNSEIVNAIKENYPKYKIIE